MKKTFILLLALCLYFSGSATHHPNHFFTNHSPDNASAVYICTGREAYAFHSREDCPGLGNCKASVQLVQYDVAVINWKRVACCRCWEKTNNCKEDNPSNSNQYFLTKKYGPYANMAVIPKFEPFQPDLNLLANVMSTLQARHDALIQQGYLYDNETETYVHKDDVPAILEKRKNDLIAAVKISAGSRFNTLDYMPKDGKHSVYLYKLDEPASMVYAADVKVKNGNVSHLLYAGKWYKAMVKKNDIPKGITANRFKKGSLFSGTSYTNSYLIIFYDDKKGKPKSSHK